MKPQHNELKEIYTKQHHWKLGDGGEVPSKF